MHDVGLRHVNGNEPFLAQLPERGLRGSDGQTALRKVTVLRVVDYTGVGSGFVQMKSTVGYDLVGYIPEARLLGDTRGGQ